MQRLSTALADRYRIVRELGRGGMATVFLAEDLKHRREVAIKVLDPEVAQAIGPGRFLREIETVARLSHPHILPLFDSGQADGLLFYVMPYVAGGSLRQRLDREKQLPVDEALRIAREVADALGYAHAHGLVHRDVKPENILLEEGHAVVADFGIARAVAGAEALTVTGTVVGTPAYLSPEQAAVSEELDGRSDLYSLACVLYEMLAGQPPFTGPTIQSLVHQHLSAAPRPVTELRPSVPALVAAALQRALAKTPADRFATATRFAEALDDRPTTAEGTPVGTEMSAPTVATAPVRRRALRRTVVAATTIALAGVLAITAWLAVRARHRESPAPAHERTEIAVLPFQNLSAGGPNAYFAGGLHEELLTQLAKVAALKVISRTSVAGYAATTKPLKQIAAELGVGSVVEGSVQVAGNRLRVNVQLIDATTDEHLWAESYDRTLDDAFAIQSEVAQRIVAAVGAELTSGEREGLAAAPTANAEAYRLYLQARDYRHRPGRTSQAHLSAQRLYEQALRLDPDFALAHAELSYVHGWEYWLRRDPSAARARLQLREAEAALRLAPDLPQAHVAMGLAFGWGRRDWRLALREFQTALRHAPNDAEAWSWYCAAQRRLGNWSEMFSAFERATRLSPRDANLIEDLGGGSFRLTHRYAEAARAYDRALSLAPDYADATFARAYIFIYWKGRLDTLRAELDRMSSEDRLWDRLRLALYERDADSLLRLVRGSRVAFLQAQNSIEPVSFFAAWAHQLRGDRGAAGASFESARALLDSLRQALPDDWRVNAAVGTAMAGSGRRQAALREARWLRLSSVYREDAYSGPSVALHRAVILAQAGEIDAALDEIERLLAGPSLLTVHVLRLDPRWDPLREHPRFKALLVKYADPEKWAVRY